MKSLVSLTSLLLLIILLCLNQHHVASQADNLINKLCKHTPSYQLCVSILRSEHLGSEETAKGLSLIALDVAKAQTTTALSDINKLMESNPGLEGPLSKCSELYNTILSDHIPKAIEAVTKDDPKGAEDGVSKAATETEECEKILSSIQKYPSLLLGNLGKFLPEIFAVVWSIIKSWLAVLRKRHG